MGKDSANSAVSAFSSAKSFYLTSSVPSCRPHWSVSSHRRSSASLSDHPISLMIPWDDERPWRAHYGSTVPKRSTVFTISEIRTLRTDYQAYQGYSLIREWHEPASPPRSAPRSHRSSQTQLAKKEKSNAPPTCRGCSHTVNDCIRSPPAWVLGVDGAVAPCAAAWRGRSILPLTLEWRSPECRGTHLKIMMT